MCNKHNNSWGNIRTSRAIQVGLPMSPHHNDDGRCEAEIKTLRILMATNAFNQMKEFLSKNLNKDIKKRIIKAIIWSVALYASETWTYKKEDTQGLEA